MKNELERLPPEMAQELKQTLTSMEQPKTVNEVRELMERDDKE